MAESLLISSGLSPTPELIAELQAAAREELSRRELAQRAERARNDLAYYHRWVMGLPWGDHMGIWCDLLQQRMFGRILAVTPPGHGKSITFSQSYVTWRLGNEPETLILLASVTATQAYLFSVADRDTIRGNERWHATFPGVVPAFEKGWAENEWFIKPVGETPEERRQRLARKDANLAAFGFDGPVIGRRGHEAIIDDPHDKDNSRTEGQRERIKAAYDPTLTSRLEGMANNRICCVATRWHEDDLLATMIRSGEYTICHMPALSDGPQVWATVQPPAELWERAVRWARATYRDRAEVLEEAPRETGLTGRCLRVLVHQRGPALWPERVSAADLVAVQKRNPRDFGKMYQGNPTPEEGRIFQRDAFRYYDPAARPAHHRIVQSWDTAFKETPGAAFSVCTTWAHGPAGAMLLDELREKLSWPELYLAIGLSYLLAEERPQAVRIEDKASGQSAIQAWQTGVVHTDFIRECERYLERGEPKPAIVRMIRTLIGEGIEAGAPVRRGQELPAASDRAGLRDLCSAMAWSLPRVIHVPVIGIKVGTDSDKQARAEDAAVWYNSGQVWHPKFAPWLQGFEYELEQCPDGAYWDRIDSASQAIVWLLGTGSVGGVVGTEILDGEDPWTGGAPAGGVGGILDGEDIWS